MSVKPVQIRFAVPAEWELAGAIAERAYASEGHSDSGEPRLESLEYLEVVRDAPARALGPTGEPLLLVAERDGELVGTATLCPPGTPHAEVALEGEMEFRFLAVEPAAQGHGIARALLESVLDHARASGAVRAVCCVIEWNEPAHRLYLARGFTRMPDRDWRPLPHVVLQAYALPLA